MIKTPHHVHRGECRDGAVFQIRRVFMRKKLFAVAVGLALSSAAAIPSFAADVKLHGHVPPVVSKLQAKGNLPANQVLDLTIGLPVRNRDGLASLIQQIYDPSSQNYHRYLSPGQFTEQFGPSEQDYKAVMEFVRKNGLTVSGTQPNRMLLNVRGHAGDIEKAFHVSFHTYQHPTENREFFSTDVEPSVPAGIAIQDIGGLENFNRPYPKYKIKGTNAVSAATASQPQKAAATGATPKLGSGPFGNYMGNDFRTAYVPGTTLTGSSQAVALVQFDGYLASDIAQYESLIGHTNNMTLQNILIDGFSGVPTGNGGEVEVSLDIEMVISMCPGLSKILVYEGNPFVFSPNDVLNRIASDNLAKQISCSWGWTGGPSTTTDQIFQEMAVQGQTFFVSSGDSCAYPAGTVDSPFNFGTPADSAYVTSVGGTTLTMGGTAASYGSEVVWNWGTRYGFFYDGVGSSGGFSSYYAIPYWQTNINMTARGGSATTRNFPDVAMTADDVVVIADGGLEYIGVGGTSVASPLWAGFMALVNEQAAMNNHTPPGFINPAIYTLANSSAYTNCFNDITSGNNTWSGSPSLFYSATNYDLCTGLGSPKGTNLINALSVSLNLLTHISPPPPPYGTNLAAVNGSNPNGNWTLFVQDDTLVGSGMISHGWILGLTTANVVGTSADLELLMTTTNGSAINLGHDITYFLTVTNYGPSISTNVIVSDSLPAGVTVVSTNATVGSVSRSGATLVWNIGTLNVGAGGQLILVLHPIAAGTYDNYALASASTPDPNPDEDSATVSVDVVVPQPPQISSIGTGTNGSISISIPALTGPSASVIVQASTNLLNWANVYTSTPPFTFTDPNKTNYPTRFYRVMLVP